MVVMQPTSPKRSVLSSNNISIERSYRRQATPRAIPDASARRCCMSLSLLLLLVSPLLCLQAGGMVGYPLTKLLKKKPTKKPALPSNPPIPSNPSPREAPTPMSKSEGWVHEQIRCAPLGLVS